MKTTNSYWDTKISFNKRRYQDTKDWSYNLEAWVGKSRFKKVCNLLKKERIASIVDIGCGDGFFLKKLDWIPHKYGLDIIDISKDDHFTYVQGDVEEGLPFKEEIFDCVFAGEIIEHLLDTEFFLEECYRVLKKGGILILTTPNLCSIRALFDMVRGKQPRFVDFSLDRSGHLRSFSPDAINFLLRKVGFEIENFCCDRLPVPFFSYKVRVMVKIEEVLGSLFPKWGNFIIVKASK